MLHKILGLGVLLVLLGYALTIDAQAGSEALPAMVRFTGTLNGPDRKPLHGVVGVNFYLYADKESRTPLWMETQNVHLDRAGHYSVMLGSTTSYGLPAEAFTGGGARWLGVQASGEAEQSRTLLFSLPYGGPPSLTAIRTSPEAANPSPQAGQKLPPTVHGNGIVNFLPLWTDTKVVGESVIAQNGSNIGIGTTTPGTIFDVFSSTPGVHAPMGRFGSSGVNDANSILTYTGSGIAEVFQSGCVNCFIPGVQIGDGGFRVSQGKNIFFGDSNTPRLKIDSVGNASQPRTANGMVKAMFKFSPFNGGRIVTCFNSTLSGAAATTPPCGFGFNIIFAGDYIFDLGSQIDDRIFSLAASAQQGVLNVCTDLDGCSDLNNQQVKVFSNGPNGFVDQKFYLVVY